MDKNKYTPTGTRKATTGFDVCNLPNETFQKMEDKRKKMGISRSEYVKNLIRMDLKEDKTGNYNKAG